MNVDAADAAVTVWMHHEYPNDDCDQKVLAFLALKEGIEKCVAVFDVCYDGERGGEDGGNSWGLTGDLLRSGFNVRWKPVPPPSYESLPPVDSANQQFEQGEESPPPYMSNAPRDSLDGMAFGLPYGLSHPAAPLEQKGAMAQMPQARPQLIQSPVEGMIASLRDLSGSPADKAFGAKFEGSCKVIISMINSEQDKATQMALRDRLTTYLETLAFKNRAFAPLVAPFLPLNG